MKFQIFGLICLTAIGMCLPVAAQTDAKSSSSVLVCRARQCAVASYSMTRGFLFNKIAQMMEGNIGKTALLCEADPVSHVCLSEGIRVQAEAAFAKTQIFIPTVKIVDTKLLKGGVGMDLVLDYDIRANHTIPRCQLGISRLNVDYVDKVEMTTSDFSCALTETGNTSLNVTYNIDYLDFDYGFIGAWYTLGVGEAVRGDKIGYVLMRLTDKVPLKTVVQSPREEQKNTAPVVDTKGVSVEAVIEPDILAETAVTPKQTVIKTEKTTAVRPKTIKTTVTETTTIIPGPNGGNAVLPTFRTVGIPANATIVERSSDESGVDEASVQFESFAQSSETKRERTPTEIISDVIYLNN